MSRTTHRSRRVAIALVAVAVVGLTSCRNRFAYDGHIESIETTGAFTTVAGWYNDSQGRIFECPDVVVSVDGSVGASNNPCTGGNSLVPRPDVDAAFGGVSGNISGRLVDLPKGTHRVCFHVVPKGTTEPGAPVDCVDHEVRFDTVNRYAIDTASGKDGVVTATGWASWFSHTSIDRFNFVTWSVDGVEAANVPGSVSTVVERPDVQAFVGPQATGRTLSVPLAAGSHSICLGLWTEDASLRRFSIGGTCRNVTVTV